MERPLALVTGGSRGIGRAVVHGLARTHHVLVGGTDPDRVAQVVAEVESASAFVADLTDPEAVREAAAGIDRLDVLVHSAGIDAHGRVEDVDRETWRRVLDVNVVAVVDLTRLLLPALRAAGGQVVAINSGSGYTSHPASSAYCASKFALRAFTDALREEERGRVRVSSIHPGRVDTDMQRKLQAEKGNTDYDGSIYIRPEAVAAAVRLAVDATEEATVETLSIRPVQQ